MDKRFRIMDVTTRVQAQLHTVQVRLMQAACKGEMSPEVLKECQHHLVDAAQFLALLPEKQ